MKSYLLGYLAAAGVVTAVAYPVLHPISDQVVQTFQTVAQALGGG